MSSRSAVTRSVALGGPGGARRSAGPQAALFAARGESAECFRGTLAGPVACERCAFEPDSLVPRCRLCALALSPALWDSPAEARICPSCLRDPPPLEGTFCLGDYRQAGPEDVPHAAPLGRGRGAGQGLREWVLALKHGGRKDLAEPLGAALAQRLLARPWPVDAAVTSVPLHPARRLERGYDQAALLARAVAARLGLPCLPALVRCRHTPPQGSPVSSGRNLNVRGAFIPRNGLAGRAWILVDDVGTSLATAREAAAALRRVPGSTVWLALVARVDPRHRSLPLAPDPLGERGLP